MTEPWILPCFSARVPPLLFNLCIIDLPLKSQNSPCLVVCIGVLFSRCLVHNPWHSCIHVLRQTSNVVEKGLAAVVKKCQRDYSALFLYKAILWQYYCWASKKVCLWYSMLHKQKHMPLQISLTQVLIALNRPPCCGGCTDWLHLQCLLSVLISPADR